MSCCTVCYTYCVNLQLQVVYRPPGMLSVLTKYYTQKSEAVSHLARFCQLASFSEHDLANIKNSGMRIQHLTNQVPTLPLGDKYPQASIFLLHCCKAKIKKRSPYNRPRRPRGGRCIPLLFLKPRRQMVVAGQHHAPAALPPGKTRYPLYRRLGGSQGRSGRVRKISPPQGFDPRTVQPVASRYTD